MKQLARTMVRLGVFGTSVTSILLLFGRSSAVIETGTNFRPHLLLATAPLTVGGLLLGDRKGAAASLLPLGLLSMSTLPYLIGDPPPLPEGTPAVRVLQYNVLYKNTDHEAILREIEMADADIVGLHELTTTQWDDLGPWLEEAYPYRLVVPADLSMSGSRGGGKALLSRTPLEAIDVPSDYPLPPLAAVTNLHGIDVLAVALHPSPARTNDWLINQRIDKMAATVAAVAAHDGPAIIITDLNIAPTSPDYGDFLDELGWDDPRRDVGIQPTFPSQGWAAPIGIAIDHVLVSRELTVHDYERGDGGGSDHRSLVATISLPLGGQQRP